MGRERTNPAVPPTFRRFIKCLRSICAALRCRSGIRLSHFQSILPDIPEAVYYARFFRFSFFCQVFPVLMRFAEDSHAEIHD